MKKRSVTKHTELKEFNVGPFEVKQPLPSYELEQVSPFILLHHGGPTTHAPGELNARLSPHPHRGFEPVTFVFGGKLHHKDSTGSEGFLNAGDVQWMTSGSGIIHSEGPSAEFAKEGGTMEMIQLWVNLPKKDKMTTPKYQDIKKDTMPVVAENGFEFRIVAGEFKNKKGPASTFTPILAMIVHFKKDARTTFTVPENFNALAYVVSGSIDINGENFDDYNMAVFNNDGDTIELTAKEDGKLLFLAGEPINEPVISYGPFVMNDQWEIRQAMVDYELGRMGVLES